MSKKKKTVVIENMIKYCNILDKKNNKIINFFFLKDYIYYIEKGKIIFENTFYNIRNIPKFQ